MKNGPTFRRAAYALRILAAQEGGSEHKEMMANDLMELADAEQRLQHDVEEKDGEETQATTSKR